MKNPKESPCVSVEYGYTSDEVREAVEHIKRVRLSKKLLESFQNTSPFVIENGEVFIKDAFISGTIHAAKIETPQPVTNIYNISTGANNGGKKYPAGMSVAVEELKSKVELNTEAFAIFEKSISENLNGIMCNALANHKETERLSDVVRDITREVIRKEMRPGGMLCGLKR
ncbi:DUF1983 domain-containing protein [Salmonella enterica]|uniref:DUF1983 domain-containing protein n=2 Tax=Salmonella enterica I TaxID=59201 RepID=A0A5V9TZ21_SALHA|nr:DUF1983 domain-containing protein [Salmonella enterica]EBP9940870.1 DUF1983 domain-containing protein [Salmonella enterica subsp. enterica]EBQ5973848.1 DUF1983 domain-containing protein [Salmonella enterica subsp. enterica serovar Kedougou]EBV8195947.1 DUF1983 domain-containing protein [Salmonella enterica subsp. enterica serovar Derby]EBW0789285.1 DUF1983 domain-containing protein [Salmonella enterica subsp. enterica serovar Muenster]EBY8740383.1 DUF1983 domain-containing protein [Salmonel